MWYVAIYTVKGRCRDALTGRAILWPVLFEEYVYNPEDRAGVDDEDEGPWTSFSIHLNTLLECLNIFGTASGSGTGFVSGPRPAWSRQEDSDNEQEGVSKNRRQGMSANGKIDSFFPRASGKGTGMRLSYAGPGYPLVLLLFVYLSLHFLLGYISYCFIGLKALKVRLRHANLPRMSQMIK